MNRAPWTEPLTIRERLTVWSLLKRDRFRYWRRMGCWQAIARRLPRTLVYAATLRAVATATQQRDCGPDDVTFNQIVDPFAPDGAY